MKIRKLRRKDLDVVSEMYRDMLYMHWTDFKDPFFKYISPKCKQNYKKFMESILSARDRIVLVAEEDGNAIGFIHTEIVGRPPVFKSEKIATIWDVAVSKESRGKGIGSKLFKELFKILKKRKVRIARLEVQHKSKAVNFYKKLKFEDHLIHLQKVIK